MPMYWSGGWGGWLVMSLVMVVFWGAVIWAIVFAVRGGSDRRDPGGRDEHGALDVLEERFARGEIDDNEFLERRKILIGQ